jgi:CelD/BcsL family acetyltransferase involved in cellulose biosynthesis
VALAQPHGTVIVLVHTFNPLEDPRWTSFVEGQVQSSVFHTSSYLDALRRTYGYQPVVYTTSVPGDPLANGIVLCRVSSWLTGSRLVSVPFADHCEPLVAAAGDRAAIVAAIQKTVRDGKLKYAQIRAINADLAHVAGSGDPRSFTFHTLDLTPPVDRLYGALHRTAIQQPVRRAEREGVRHESGRSDALLQQFYSLLVTTRRRHGLPPQPMPWFSNLAACFGDRLTVHVASREEQPLAAILTLRHRDVLVYKYGASDERFHRLGAMPLLLWKAILDAKDRNLRLFDLGRTDADNSGLATFKERLGATRSSLTYVRWAEASRKNAGKDRHVPGAARVFASLPDEILVAAGKLLYRHMG